MTSRASNWPDPVPYSELSERQQEILEFLWNCPSPYSPSFREIGNAVGLTGPSAVRYQIVKLERKGWVEAEWGTSELGRRAKLYRITKAGREQLATEMAAWKKFATGVSKVLFAS